MDAIIRGVGIYLFLVIVFSITGRRVLAEATNFDLVLLLIISETVQQSLLDGDDSVTRGLLLILTLIGVDGILSFIKNKFPAVDKWIDGKPVVVVSDGKPIKELMEKLRLDDEDILEAARIRFGLERMEQVKYAILEKNGEISIVPKNLLFAVQNPAAKGI
jgi:uncharacterized membrane protein YcaP (DUF421 family)